MSQTTEGIYQRLICLLTMSEVEKLVQALEAVQDTAAGWGDLHVHLKAGRVDTIDVTASILVRSKQPC